MKEAWGFYTLILVEIGHYHFKPKKILFNTLNFYIYASKVQ